MLFFHCINNAVVNSFILFETHREDHRNIEELSGKTGFDQLAFQIGLVNQILDMDDRHVPPPPPPKKSEHKLQDSRHGFKLSALVKEYELAQSTISTILKAGSTTLLKAGTSGHADKRKRIREPCGSCLTIDRSAPGTSGNADGPSDAPNLKISLLKAVRFVTARGTRTSLPRLVTAKPGTETADLTELWEHVATGDADSGCCRTAALCDSSDSSDEEVDSASTTPSMTTQGALTSIDSLIDFMHIKGMPPEFSAAAESYAHQWL
ncbi:hypothetical protein HPB52_005780 [Rhipicephalus sanguineus]|uniref:Uncharacterized protein n=1 Tax=Rhipicephalus sanguineus TaxID=34632 RepID=A0A9D4SXU9_RHISA|nr:hypothetical protein HPB52_005780 [Rhipicephalus sanguineus]